MKQDSRPAPKHLQARQQTVKSTSNKSNSKTEGNTDTVAAPMPAVKVDASEFEKNNFAESCMLKSNV